MRIEWVEGDQSPIFAELAEIRQAVFTQEQGFPAEIDLDEHDALALHLILREKGRVVGILRLYQRDNGDYQIGRVALLKAYRGQGFGRTMMEEAIGKVQELLTHRSLEEKSVQIQLNAQVAAQYFYEQLGFKAVSAPFLEEGEPHMTMKRTVTAKADLSKGISPNLLKRADKVLFIAHLAIGDFTYLQNGFKAFAEQYPHIQVDIWIDEVRRTADASKWESLKNYSLYDWAEASGIFHQVYRETYSPELFEQSIKKAQAESYPLVISLATLRPYNYALLARKIAGTQGYVATMDFKTKFYQFKRKRAKQVADYKIERASKNRRENYHISEDYAHWFSQLGVRGLDEKARYPFVNIPKVWEEKALERLESWGVKASQKVVLINHIAKNRRRSWELSQVAELIEKMQALPDWRDTFFIINGIPPLLPEIESMIRDRGLKNSVAFSATENFFELPAMLAKCDLIISVETAVMHLANAVHVPVIALMRLKTPEWRPLNEALTTLIFTPERRHVMKDISPDRVIEALPNLNSIKE